MKLIIQVILSLLMFSCSSNKSIPDNVIWKETFGRVLGMPNQKYIEYEVGGNKYKQRFYRSYYGMPYEGVIYSLKYDLSNPENIEICYSCPIFLSDEQTKVFEGEIQRIFWTGGYGCKRAFEYTYYIEGMKVTKTQGLQNNYKEVYPNFRKNARYQVKVWVEDRNRAVLYPDLPIKSPSGSSTSGNDN